MKTTHVFLNTDLRLGHAGLTMLASRAGLNLRLLGDGEAVLFINESCNKVKSFSYNGVLSYLRVDDKRSSLSLLALDLLPQIASSSERMRYSREAKAVLGEIMATARGLKIAS